MRTTKKVLSLLLAMTMIVGLMPAMLSTVSAAAATYQLAELLNQNKIKPLGRTAVNPDGTGIM